MKNLIIILLLSLIFFACSTPIEEINKYYLDNNVKEFINIQVYPNQEISKVYSLNSAEQDWNSGILYKENSKIYDDKIHEIDLSVLTGGKQALVYLEIKVIDHGYDFFKKQYDDSAGNIYIREKNNNVQWNSVCPRFNEYIQSVLILTDETGKIEWYHDHIVDFWDNPTCDLGYEIYKWEKITITAKWLVTGIIIK